MANFFNFESGNNQEFFEFMLEQSLNENKNRDELAQYDASWDPNAAAYELAEYELGLENAAKNRGYEHAEYKAELAMRNLCRESEYISYIHSLEAHENVLATTVL